VNSASSIKLVLPLLACASVFGGCTRTPTNAPPVPTQAPVANFKPPRDDLGREIRLTAPPRRIVTIGPAVTETIFALGEGSRLVGRDQVSNFPAEQTAKIAVVGDYNGPVAEKVVAARPELIIVQGETYDKARVEAWEKQCGAPVAALAPHSVLEVAKGMDKIGAWLGVPKQAALLSGPLFTRVKTAPRPLPGKTAFFEVMRSPSLWTSGRGTLINDVMGLAGLTNIADIQGYKQYNLETLTAKQPQLYIVATEGAPDRMRTLEELRRQPSLRGLKCVQQGRVLVIPADLLVRPGPRLLAGIAALEQGARAITAATKK
jgi:iron complex transport system substrate-binding protein